MEKWDNETSLVAIGMLLLALVICLGIDRGCKAESGTRELKKACLEAGGSFGSDGSCIRGAR